MAYDQLVWQLVIALVVAVITSGLGAMKSQVKPNAYLFGYTFVLSIISSLAAVQGLQHGAPIDGNNVLVVIIEMLGLNGILHAGQRGAAALHIRALKK